MTANQAAETETVEINLDLSKLLGFEALAGAGVDAAVLAQAMEDLHGKVGQPEPEIIT